MFSDRAYAGKMIEAPLVKVSSRDCNADAMHHINVQRIGKDKWLAAVDALGPVISVIDVRRTDFSWEQGGY